MLFFRNKPKNTPEQAKKEKEGDVLHARVMQKVKKLDKETAKLEAMLDDDVSYRIFLATGGDKRAKQ